MHYFVPQNYNLMTVQHDKSPVREYTTCPLLATRLQHTKHALHNIFRALGVALLENIDVRALQ
jgi:hypothetical protein